MKTTTPSPALGTRSSCPTAGSVAAIPIKMGCFATKTFPEERASWCSSISTRRRGGQPDEERMSEREDLALRAMQVHVSRSVSNVVQPPARQWFVDYLPVTGGN